jgi:choline dehydrogenase-like flavoprotein
VDELSRFDVVIVGSGFGGATVAHALHDTGVSILVLERGDFLKQERQNWDVGEVVVRRRYDARETWYDGRGKPFTPRLCYAVGGSSKVFGGAAMRLRAEDFLARQHDGGSTVSWPYCYAELAPYYERAEELLQVHGQSGEDPTEPARGDYPFPPAPHEPFIAELARRLQSQGLHPFHVPLAIDQGPGGRCQKGSPCDGFPCLVRAKGDAENRLLRPLLLKGTGNLTVWTRSYVERLETSPDGQRVVAARVRREAGEQLVTGDLFVVSAGAVNSAALLLRSRGERHPGGLANSSGLVGRNFMSHHNSVLLCLSPWRKNPTRFQKTLAWNDFYSGGSASGRPLGHVQMRGKVRPENLLRHRHPLVRLLRQAIAERSLDLWIMSEDLPDPENRVTVDEDGRIHLARRGPNLAAHRELLRRVRRIMRRAGYPICLVDHRGVRAIQHQCGTVRFGADPARAVLDPWCRAYDLENLYVVDASFFPSSGAVNPSLTIVAQALRAAEQMRRDLSQRPVSAR